VKNIEPLVTKFNTYIDLEAPWSGIDLQTKAYSWKFLGYCLCLQFNILSVLSVLIRWCHRVWLMMQTLLICYTWAIGH